MDADQATTEAISTVVDFTMVCAAVNETAMVQAEAVEVALFGGGSPNAPETIAAFAAFGAAWQLQALLQSDFVGDLDNGDDDTESVPIETVRPSPGDWTTSLARSTTWNAVIMEANDQEPLLLRNPDWDSLSAEESYFSRGQHGSDNYAAAVKIPQCPHEYAALA